MSSDFDLELVNGDDERIELEDDDEWCLEEFRQSVVFE